MPRRSKKADTYDYKLIFQRFRKYRDAIIDNPTKEDEAASIMKCAREAAARTDPLHAGSIRDGVCDTWAIVVSARVALELALTELKKKKR